MDWDSQLAAIQKRPVSADARSPTLARHQRPLSRHEIVSMYSQRQLPIIPATSSLRSRNPHGRSCSDSVTQMASSPTPPSLQSPNGEPARWSLYPREATSLQALKSDLPNKTKTLPKSSSFSSIPSAGYRKSSQKVHQLFGHDLDVMEAAKQPSSQNEVRLSAYLSFLEEYYASGSTGSDSDGTHLHSEDGMLPLIEEDDETSSSRESSWVPSTPTAMPDPLRIRRKTSSESEESLSSDITSIRNSVRNFSLHGSSPKRWDPAYGQFTDRKAAGAYHKFASELATSAPQQQSQKLQVLVGAGEAGSLAVGSPPQEDSNKKSWAAGRFRLSGTAAFSRLWDTAPEANTRPAEPVRRNTLKKPPRPPAKPPAKAPEPKTVRVVPSMGSVTWPMIEELTIEESPSKKNSRKSRKKTARAGKPILQAALEKLSSQEPATAKPAQKTTLKNPPMEKKQNWPNSRPDWPATRKPSHRRSYAGNGTDKAMMLARAPLTVDTKLATSTPSVPRSKKSPVLEKSPPPTRQHCRSQSMPVRPPRSPASPKQEPPKQGGIPCSAFDSDSDDEDPDTGSLRWFSKRAVEDGPEWPRVQWTRKVEPLDKEETMLGKTGGQVRGLITNARERALMSPAERRRSELRRSIRVLQCP